MSKFKVGDKVTPKSSVGILHKGKMYTVKDLDGDWVALNGNRISHESCLELVVGAKDDTKHNKHHKHHDAIIAWVKGEEIEVKCSLSGGWFNAVNPTFTDHMEYRIKPTESEFKSGFYLVIRHGKNRIARITDEKGRDRALADGCKIIKRINESEWNV